MNSEKSFYVYMYLRKDGVPYYVGKGMGKRAFTKSRKVKPPPKNRIVILDKLTEDQAFQQEMEHIAFYGRKDKGSGVLLNLTDGGAGALGSIKSSDSIHKQKVIMQINGELRFVSIHVIQDYNILETYAKKFCRKYYITLEQTLDLVIDYMSKGKLLSYNKLIKLRNQNGVYDGRVRAMHIKTINV